MEQFNIPHQKIREKSVYLVHLDAPRIAVISAAVIGIIIASFLLGMNFIKGGESGKTVMMTNDVFDAPRELDLLKGNIPGQPDVEELSRSADEKLLSLDRLDIPATEEKSAEEPANLLTKDNIAAPAHSEKTVEKKVSVPAKKKRSRVRDASYSAKSKEKKAPEKRTAKKSGSSRVVAVSGDMKTPKGDGFFSVQVASYDTRNRASSEVGVLRGMDYDAYIDETRVNGKRYYRVRVGRSASKVRALELLEEIQGVEKYRESYMVRE
ncbi:MAG: SPOR domain-containing protein [Spirochaetes bacterium]|nr:SPOR domain-containing protein [Spirochaetota bacterium]